MRGEQPARPFATCKYFPSGVKCHSGVQRQTQSPPPSFSRRASASGLNFCRQVYG